MRSRTQRMALFAALLVLGSCYSTHYARSSNGIREVEQATLEWDAENLTVVGLDTEQIDIGSVIVPACQVKVGPGAHDVRVKVRGLEDTVKVTLNPGGCYTVDSWSGKYIEWLPFLGVHSAPGSGGFVIVDGCNMRMSKSAGKVIAVGGRKE
jgi:hypothetical protein